MKDALDHMTNYKVDMGRAQAAANAAFNKALQSGRLSSDEVAENYVGDFMFMGHDDQGRALFKHYNTRRYLP